MEDIIKVNSAQELFDIMDGVTEKRESYPNLIKEYLQTKDRKIYYMIGYEDPMYDDTINVLKHLSDDNVAEIESLVDAYVEKEYPEEVANGGKEDKAWRKDIMTEVAQANYKFMDLDYLCSYNLMGEQMAVENINLYEKYYCYKVKVAAFYDGINNAPEIIEMNLNLPDDIYIYLTTEYMIDSNLTFNHLRTKNEEVYARICRMIDDKFYDSDIPHRIPTYAVELDDKFYDSDIPHRIPTYAVELTEIIEDAKKILQSNGIE